MPMYYAFVPIFGIEDGTKREPVGGDRRLQLTYANDRNAIRAFKKKLGADCCIYRYTHFYFNSSYTHVYGDDCLKDEWNNLREFNMRRF